MNPSIGEYVPKNYVRLGLYRSFWFYGFTQMISGSCRVDVRNRYVTRPSVYQKCYTVVTAIITGIIYTNTISRYIIKFKVNHNLYLLSKLMILTHFSVFVIHLFHVRFLNNDNNVNFVIKLQKIDLRMKIDQINRFTTIIRKLTNLSIMMALAGLSFLFACSLYDGTIVVITSIATGTVCESILIIDLALCCTLMAYFIIRIRFVNSIIANHLKQHDDFVLYGQFFNANSFYRKLAAKSHDFKSCDTDVYLKEIMEGFYEFQSIFRFQVNVFVLLAFGTEFIRHTSITKRHNCASISHFFCRATKCY